MFALLSLTSNNMECEAQMRMSRRIVSRPGRAGEGQIGWDGEGEEFTDYTDCRGFHIVQSCR